MRTRSEYFIATIKNVIDFLTIFPELDSASLHLVIECLVRRVSA